LGDLVSLEYGKALKAEERSTNGRYPVYGSNGIVGSYDEAFVKEPTIVVGRKGAIGEAHLAQRGCWPIDTAFYTVFRQPGVMTLPFLLLWFRSSDLKSLAITATIPGLNRNTLYSQQIPVPPLAAQDRIVKLLGEADELRKLRAQADRYSADLIPALFHEMFGDPTINTRNWRRETLSDLLDGIDGGWSPTCQDRPAQPGEWGVLKLGAVTTCEYIPTENKALTEGFAPRPELEVKAGDLLFTRKNTYELVAASALVFETRPNLMLSDLIFRFRLKSDVQLNTVFLWGLLTTSSKRKQVQTLASGSAGSMPNISKGRLLTLPIEVPPLPMQTEFANRVTEIRELEAKQAASRERLDALFQSMLYRAFRGEL
jgi:type I restriction enzyme S subunit